jgi:hypothetical protein
LGNINKESLEDIMNQITECFPKPRRFCTVNHLASEGVDLRGLDQDDKIKGNRELLKSVPATDLPDLYKKMI